MAIAALPSNNKPIPSHGSAAQEALCGALAPQDQLHPSFLAILSLPLLLSAVISQYLLQISKGNKVHRELPLRLASSSNTNISVAVGIDEHICHVAAPPGMRPHQLYRL